MIIWVFNKKLALKKKKKPCCETDQTLEDFSGDEW